jgi:uncharacterized protein
MTGHPLRQWRRARVLAVALMTLALARSVPVATAQSPAPPTLTGPVNDFANVIEPERERELERRILALQKASGDVVVVATVPSLEPFTNIEEYAVKMFENGGKGIGQKGKDNGALLIVAPEEREVRIEIGYGLEGELTDAQSRTIIETRILPHFREGDFAAGIKDGVAAMIDTLGGSYDPALAPVQVPESARAPSAIPFAILLPIIMIILLNVLFNRRRGRFRGYGPPIVLPGDGGGRSGGFGGGGSSGGFSGGGGSFGGGGASGRW